MKTLFLYFVLCFHLIFTFGCKSDIPDTTLQNPKISAALHDKELAFTTNGLSECYKRILFSAEQHVDSIIAEEIIYHLSDSISFPEKPVKPASLGTIIVPDSIKAKPIIKNKNN